MRDGYWTSRRAERLRFTSLEQAFKALHIHDLDDQAFVRQWVEGEFRTDDEWDQFFVEDHEAGDPRWPWPAETMFSDPECGASLWMPPGGGYVAVGGFVGNYELIAARIHRTRLVIEYRGLKYTPDEPPSGIRKWWPSIQRFPSATDIARPRRGEKAADAVCEQCGIQLPATGICDTCD